jgi:hypothetical protein
MTAEWCRPVVTAGQKTREPASLCAARRRRKRCLLVLLTPPHTCTMLVFFLLSLTSSSFLSSIFSDRLWFSILSCSKSIR